jgi:hypothetical protein
MKTVKKKRIPRNRKYRSVTRHLKVTVRYPIEMPESTATQYFDTIYKWIRNYAAKITKKEEDSWRL